MNSDDRLAFFQQWAPPDVFWFTWAKPVLFACMESEPRCESGVAEFDTHWLSADRAGLAIVCDLPGVTGVEAGLAFAGRGWRPVPLYNAVHFPEAGIAQAVNVGPILEALWNGRKSNALASLPEDAPPVFLLDAKRRGLSELKTGDFDNRSISFVTDFPSAGMLVAHGIRSVVLVQETGDQPQPDLAHTLRRWEEAGVVLLRKRLDATGAPVRFSVERPSRFRGIWQRVLAAIGLKDNRLGGFGGWLGGSGSGG